jgi:hypothetical protein
MQHVITMFTLGMIVLSGASIMVREYPFSIQNRRGERTQRWASLILMAPFMMLMRAIQFFTYSHPVRWGVMIVGCVLVSVVLESFGKYKLDRTLHGKELLA